MMNKNTLFRLAIIMLLMALLIPGCVPEGEGNITPRADLIFVVMDESGTPIPNAQVLLFPFRTPYEDYLTTNPDGDPNQGNTLDAEDIAVTNSLGEAIFANRPLDGTSYASGTTYIHQPNSIYFRVQAEYNSGFVTNDSNDPATYRLAFPELESGDIIREEIEVFVR